MSAELVAPPRPGDAIAWSSRDEENDLIHMWTEDGLWFTFDFKSGKTIDPPCEQLSDEEWLAEMHRHADEDEGVAKCYFIGGEEGPVKIGYSIDAKSRLRAIQLYSPIKLQILALASGGIARESAYHFQFREARLHGEWFERTPEIIAEIERLSA